MAITSSAKKALRASKHKRVFNLRRKSAIDSAVKKFKALLAAKNSKEAQVFMATLSQAYDKAAKTGYIKKNAAARLKSRASAAIKKIA